MVRVKKYFLLILFTVLFFIGKENVWAADPPSATAELKNGDYSISCVYENGLTVSVTKKDIETSTLTTSSNQSTERNQALYLTPDQRNSTNWEGKVTSYNSHKFLANGVRCPSTLYAYFVDADDLENVEEGSDVDTTIQSDLYLYSTSNNIDLSDIAYDDGSWFFGLGSGSAAEKKPEENIQLVSEYVKLTPTNNTTICDYQIKSTDDSTTGSGSTLSIYLYQNQTFVSANGYVTMLDTVLSDCPTSAEGEIIYVNSPRPQQNISGNGYGASTYYGAVRYYQSKSKSDCKDENDDVECTEYLFLGTRNDKGDSEEGLLCERLGGELVAIIQENVGILQIVVPALVIVLTGIDIGRLVVSGNLDEELPKRKKLMVIRFVVMLFFFFLPQITDMIIGLLQTAELIGIEKVECIFN